MSKKVCFITRNFGKYDPDSLKSYESIGGFTALRKALTMDGNDIADVLAAAPDTRCFRDPTRGGLASTLNEFAQASGVAMEIDEDAVPVRPDVQAACEMLGYDVLQVANEGKMVVVVPAEQADAALAAMRAARYGENAAIIGRVLPLAEGARPAVRVRTGWGSTRILDMLVGEQLPRIC